MKNEFTYDVFLSHSSKDKAVVRDVAERLRKDGVKVWFDEWVLKPGDSIPAKIGEGLEYSRVLVLCMSANAFGSDWAQLEADTFRFRDPLNLERRFIPLRLDDAEIKGSLAQFLYINWHPAEREQEYEKLLEACYPIVISQETRTAMHEMSNENDLILRKTCWPVLYHWKGCSADAIRLTAEQNEIFPVERIEITLEESHFSVPEQLTLDRDELISWVRERARKSGSPYHDSRCIRLINYRAAARDDSEERWLELTLGWMTWSDYVLANQRFGDAELFRLFGAHHNLFDFIRVMPLANDGNLGASGLANILTVYVSATTTDGYLIFSHRGERVTSHRNLFISAVSENLHPIKDGFSIGCSDGGPLFQCAARGIQDELSPSLTPRNPVSDLRLLGLGFLFQAYHPAIFFLASLPYTLEQVKDFIREDPGNESEERAKNEIMAVHLSNNTALKGILERKSWFSGGKACVIRTLQYLTAESRERALSLAEVAATLAPARPIST